MSDNKKAPSPYVVFENRSLDQWKVTELKEELKRRKLITRGLKDDLVKRLDEAIRAEIEEANQNHENGVNNVDKSELPSDDATKEPIVAEKTTTITEDTSTKNTENESMEEDNVTEKLNKNEKLDQDNITEKLDDEKRDNNDMPSKEGHGTEGFQVVQEVSVQTSVKTSVETSVTVSEVMVSQELGKQELQKDEINKEDVSNTQESKASSSPKKEAEPNSSEFGSQVVEVSQVKSDSISIVSITELKDNVIADDVKLELDVTKTEPIQEKDVHKIAETESINISKKNDSLVDVGSPEKLNLDDDSMEEDALENNSKQNDSNFSEKTEVPLVDVMIEDTNTESSKEKSDPAVVFTKRKQYDQEAVTNTEVVKRQRRWNSENAPEQQNVNSPVSTTPKGTFQTSVKHSFSRSDSSVSHEEPKERVVPPSSKAPTTSLRIDRFLRPFTLKAVQELLGKTGTVVSFWMDQIKTHCYVTYSSVEEAVETRNAVYNLQWPANGGRLLIAEFVDPSEVKTRTEPPTPATTTTTTTPQPPPTSTQHHLPPPPPLPLPPPPPLSRQPPQQQHLPPPPPLPEKLEPPIMTLDDLFRKTRATPRIYYLPLSDKEVAGKLKAQGKTAQQ